MWVESGLLWDWRSDSEESPVTLVGGTVLVKRGGHSLDPTFLGGTPEGTWICGFANTRMNTGDF